MSVTSRTSQISSIFTSWVELCRWHKAFLFSKTAGVTDWLPRAAVRNLGLLPLLAAEVVICGQLSYLSHPPMTGCGMGVIKNPSQSPFRSMHSTLWVYTNSASSFQQHYVMHFYTVTKYLPCKCTETFLGCFLGLLLALFQKLMTRYLKIPSIKSVFLISWN